MDTMPDNCPAYHLAVESLTKEFDSFTAVRDVTFAVTEGEFLTLLGPSGSGKTTLLRMLGGFEYPTGGQILLHGQDVAYLPPYRRNIGMVFQKYALFPHMDVFENVAFPLRRRGVNKEGLENRVNESLAMVGLTGLETRHPRQLSGGQQQRVALARSFVFNPEMLLMDEPLGALDKQLRDHMQREIRALQQRIGITTVYVTHDQTEAMTMSDRVAVMNEGEIEQIGTPSELYEKPKTEFVARFVGDSNLIPVTCAGSAQGVVELKTEDGTVLRCSSEEIPVLGVGLKILIRPEKLRINDDEKKVDQKITNVIRGNIVTITYLGESTLFEVSVNDLLVTVKQTNRSGGQVPDVGQKITLVWSIDDCSIVC
jgi:putative spermidine/putrescine transport system ATP-binding protein